MTYEPKIDPDKCLGRVWSDGSLRSHQCSRKPTTYAGYCRQHDPQLVAMRNAVKQQQWEAEREARNDREVARRAKKARLLAIVNDEALEILRELGVAP